MESVAKSYLPLIKCLIFKIYKELIKYVLKTNNPIPNDRRLNGLLQKTLRHEKIFGNIIISDQNHSEYIVC